MGVGEGCGNAQVGIWVHVRWNVLPKSVHFLVVGDDSEAEEQDQRSHAGVYAYLCCRVLVTLFTRVGDSSA